MPPKLRNSIEQEGRILLAISSLKKAEIQSIRQAAQDFQVPYTTLQNRLKGAINRVDTRANSHKLTPNEEESLIRWILSMDQRGAPPRPSHVRDMANILLSKRGSISLQTVGINWVYNFIKRRDKLKSRWYNYQRAKYEDPKVIKEWFDHVQVTIMQYGILYNDIYNFDETGYTIGLVATTKVVTRAKIAGRPHLI